MTSSVLQREEVDLPKSDDFSPGTVGLSELLEICAATSGDRSAAKEQIRRRFFAEGARQRSDPKERREQQEKRAGNVLSSLVSFGLYDGERQALTSLGESIASLSSGEQADALAEHILKNLSGMLIIECMRAIHGRGAKVQKKSLEAELKSHGIALPSNSTRATRILQWLAEAGVVEKIAGNDWSYSEERITELTGVVLEDADAWRLMTPEQRAFLASLRQLAEVHGTEFIQAQRVREQAELLFGVTFDKSQMAQKIHRPLVDNGWIEHQLPKRGRGGKAGEVAATRKLLDAPLDLYRSGGTDGIPPEVREKLRVSLPEIAIDLNSRNTHKKGLALEVLAVKMAIDLGLEPKAFRLRGQQTGGAEVDLVADGVHRHFSRWLFQCKNKYDVSVTEVLKEMGLAQLLGANVVVIVTTGRIRGSIGKLVAQTAERTAVQVVVVPTEVVDRYLAGDVNALIDSFGDAAQQIARSKQTQLLGLGP